MLTFYLFNCLSVCVKMIVREGLCIFLYCIRIMNIRPDCNIHVPKSGPQKKDWTVLMYFNGRNDLEHDLVKNFLTAEEAADNKKMNMLAQLGRSGKTKENVDDDWTGVRRYEMDKGNPTPYPGKRFITRLGEHDGKIDSKLIKDLGDADMSDKNTLAEFIEWGVKNYPAENYMIVLAGHGGGFTGSLPDDKSKKNMSLADTRAAFEQAREKTGVKPDVLLMDACLMGGVEAAGELANVAGYYIASEDVNMDCFPMHKIMETTKKEMEKYRELSPEGMAEAAVNQADSSPYIPAVSAVKTDKIKDLTGSMKTLADALIKTDTDPEAIRNVVKNTKGASHDNPDLKPAADFKDMGDLCRRLLESQEIKDKKLKKAAGDALRTYSETIFKQGATHDATGVMSGMTIYFPVKGFNYNGVDDTYLKNTDKAQYESTYKNLGFVKKTGWDRVIKKFAETPEEKPVRGADVLDDIINGNL